MHGSSQVARLNQTLQQSNSIGTKVFQARKNTQRRLTPFKFYVNISIANSVSEQIPVSDCCHGDGQVASNRDACFDSPDDRVHARSVCELWRWVGCQSGDGPGTFWVLGVAVELQP